VRAARAVSHRAALRRLYRVAGALAGACLALVVGGMVGPRLLEPRPVPAYFTRGNGAPCACIFGIVPGRTPAARAPHFIIEHPASQARVTDANGYDSYTLFSRGYSVEAWNRPTVTSVSLWMGFDNDLLTVGEVLVAFGQPSAAQVYLPDAQSAFLALAYERMLVITSLNDGFVRPTSTVYYIEFHDGNLNPESPTYLFNSNSVYQMEWLGLGTLRGYLNHPSLRVVPLE